MYMGRRKATYDNLLRMQIHEMEENEVSVTTAPSPALLGETNSCTCPPLTS